MGALRTVAAVAALNFLIQGIFWCVLSLLAILAYNCQFIPNNDPLDESFTAMARIYFTEPSCWNGGEEIAKLGLTSASVMITISSIQFVLNFMLSIVSLIVIFVIPRGSTHAFLLWTYKFMFFCLATAILDLITASVFSSDKDISSGISSTHKSSGLRNMLLIASLVAARGYLYWCLNVMLVLYLLLASTMRLFKACKKLDEVKPESGIVNPAFDALGGQRLMNLLDATNGKGDDLPDLTAITQPASEQGYPNYSARSRWPWLGVPLWRRELLSRAKINKFRDQADLKDRAGFGVREAFEHRPSFQEHTKQRSSFEDHRQWNGSPGNWQMNGSPGSRQWNGSPRNRQWNNSQQTEVHANQRKQADPSENTLPNNKGNGFEKQRPEQFVPRPDSLHEAILTLKPLRQVRPRIPDMQTRY